jgi:hypothetical protein
MKMRAVCLREPWLYLMLDLPSGFRKDVENRGKKLTKTLGPILVKSSAANRGSKKLNYEDSDLSYYSRVREQVLGWGWFPEELFPKFDQLQFGGIRGALNFSELLPPAFGSDLRWKFPDSFGYVVDRYVRFPFRPLKGGGQGIFYTEPSTVEVTLLKAAGLLADTP